MMTNNKPSRLSNALLIGGTLLGTAAAFVVSNSLQGNSTKPAEVAATEVSSVAPVQPAEMSSHAGFWPTLQIVADEAEGYESLSEMAASVDHVVVGRMSNFRLNRRIFGDSPENVVHMAAVDLEIDQVVRGADPGRHVVLEFLLPGRPQQIAAKVQQQAATIPHEPMLFFLRHKGGSEAGLYRVVNSLGLWLAEAGSVRAPLSIELHPQDVPRPQRVHSDEEAARELAARPAHLRHAAKPASAVESPGPSDMEEEETEASPLAPYAEELANVHSLDDLVKHLAR